MKKLSLVLLVVPLFLACPKKEAPPPTTTSTPTTTISTAPPPQLTPKPDHYKFWTTSQVHFEPQTFTLQGQFDNEPWKTTAHAVLFLGNPVDKNKGGINNATRHYVAYQIEPPLKAPAIEVALSNQLEKETKWLVTGPVLLLLPANKSLTQEVPPKPEGGDHYACYRVNPMEPIPVEKTLPGKIQLVDQFDKKREKVETIKSVQPKYFCVPVHKNGERIYDEKTHLALYQIKPADHFPITVLTTDQWGTRKHSINDSAMLAVPSTKLGFKKQ